MRLQRVTTTKKIFPNTQSKRKRARSEGETEDNENDDNNSIEPPQKKRRICPKDITRALQTDSSLKEFAHLIQLPNTPRTTNNKQKSSIMDMSNLNCLDGVVISFEGNFEISNTLYASQLKRALENQYLTQQNKENIYQQILQNHNQSNTTSASKPSIIGSVLKENISTLLTTQFLNTPNAYCLTWLYHLSTMLSQKLHFAVSSRDNRFIIMNRSPISCLSMAMLFKNKKWLNNEEFRLYLTSHQSELFPPCYRPDITIYIEQVM